MVALHTKRINYVEGGEIYRGEKKGRDSVGNDPLAHLVSSFVSKGQYTPLILITRKVKVNYLSTISSIC